MQENSQPLYVRLNWHDVATSEGKEHSASLPITLGRFYENTIVLNSSRISRQHASLIAEAGRVVLLDNQSTNGTFIDQERITRKVLADNTSFQLGPFHFTVTILPALPQDANIHEPRIDELGTVIMDLSPVIGRTGFLGNPSDAGASLVFSHETGALVPFATAQVVEAQLTPESFRAPVVPIQDIYRRQGQFVETTYLAVGAGLGSFTWVDHLRICGIPPEQVVALGPEPRAHARYERLARNSQIPAHERLRSNSDSCPDNIWGWPSYGLREIGSSLQKGQFKHAAHIAGWVFGEPVLTYTYTPRSGDVFKSLDREAHRIGWERIWQEGWAQSLRKTDDGRYVVAYSFPNGQGKSIQRFVVARYVHLAMGYPGVRLLPDLQRYRASTGDTFHVVNAYEEHNHVYEHLLKNGGVVIVRGRGVVASRVIQRLYEVRQKNQGVVILHIHRYPIVDGHRDGRARRRVKNYTELQPFNWPKACWTGAMRFELEKADDEKRDRLLNDWGGTTTADRTDWQRLAQRGVREGWYQNYFGEVKALEQNSRGQLLTQLSTGKVNQPEISLTSDFIVDCTGLDAALEFNPFVKDMVDCYQLGRNPKGRLRVTNDFEVIGMNNGTGHLYASGILTLGGPLAAADSFLGLQYAALRSVEALAQLQAPGVRRITPARSFSQWVRWLRGGRP
jgi:pSer/pThr/pTyr-binding forkhead associated (FHA) protein